MPFFRLFFLTCSSARTHRCVCVWLWLLPGFLGLSVCVCGCVCVCVWVCRAEGTTEPGRPKSFSRALKRAASSRVLSRVLRTTPKKKPNKNKRNTPQRPNRLCVGVCVGLCVCVCLCLLLWEKYSTQPRQCRHFFPFFFATGFILRATAQHHAVSIDFFLFFCWCHFFWPVWRNAPPPPLARLRGFATKKNS